MVTISLADTNDNPEMVDYAIPANNDALKALEYTTSLVCEAVLDGKANPVIKEEPKKPEAKPVVAKVAADKK